MFKRFQNDSPPWNAISSWRLSFQPSRASELPNWSALPHRCNLFIFHFFDASNSCYLKTVRILPRAFAVHLLYQLPQSLTSMSPNPLSGLISIWYLLVLSQLFSTQYSWLLLQTYLRDAPWIFNWCRRCYLCSWLCSSRCYCSCSIFLLRVSFSNLKVGNLGGCSKLPRGSNILLWYKSRFEKYFFLNILKWPYGINLNLENIYMV